MVFNLLLTRFTLLLDQTVLQPALEGPVALLLFNFLVQPLLFLLSQLLLLL